MLKMKCFVLFLMSVVPISVGLGVSDSFDKHWDLRMKVSSCIERYKQSEFLNGH